MNKNDLFRKQMQARAAAAENADSYFANAKRIRQNFNKWTLVNSTVSSGFLSHTEVPQLTYTWSLSEPDVGVYVNGAQQKARQAFVSGFRAWNTKYHIGFVQIEARVKGRHIHVDARGNDSFYFEFASSSMPITFESPTGFPIYLPVVVGVNVKVGNGAITPEPEIREGRRADLVNFPLVDDTSIINRGFQVGLVNEPVSHPFGEKQLNRMRYPIKLFESFAPSHAHHSVHFRSVSWGSDEIVSSFGDTGNWKTFWLTEKFRNRKRGGFTLFRLRDIGYDVPFQKSENFNDVQTGVLVGSTDWPRAMGLQRVEHPVHGVREFAVYVDAFSQFWIFPTAAIEPFDGSTQNVDALYVKQATYTKPSWAFMAPGSFKTYYAGTPSFPLIDYPETDWKANHDGTKFAAIVYEREPFNFDSTYFTTSVGSLPFTSTSFGQLRDQLGADGRWQVNALQSTHATQRYFVAPGVIELAVAITITGPNLEDFTVNGTLTEVRRPTTSDNCALAVGYVYHNIPFSSDETTRVAAPGDLVFMDVEQWAKDKVREDPIQLLTILKSDGTALFSSKVPTSIMAVDLTTLSFVARVDNLRQDTQVKPNGTGIGTSSVTMETDHFALWAVIGLKSKEAMFPDTMAQARRDELQAMIDAEQGFNGRLEVLEGGYYKVPLTESRDWSDTAMANARAYLAQESQTGHKSGSVSLTTAIDDTFTQWYWEWAPSQPLSYLMYCATPKFGWACYADLICQYLNMGSQVTFFTHPNGSWAYWDNSHIYNPIGACVDVSLYAIDQYSVWNPALIEHCIFDRVHFEVRTNKGIIAQLDTTFLKLHNDGVRVTAAKGDLQAGIQQIVPSDLRATFAKEAISLGLGTKTYLNIKMTWNGTTYQLPESIVQGGSTGSTFMVPGGWRSIEMAMGGLWTDMSSNVTEPASDSDAFHVRFANPLLIDGVKENIDG